MTMPSSRSSTTPGYRNGSGWRWAGFERSICGRRDGVGDVPVVVAGLAVEVGHVVAEPLAAAVEHAAHPEEGRDHGGGVVRRPAHQPEPAFGPVAMHPAAHREVRAVARRQPHRVVGRPVGLEPDVAPCDRAVVEGRGHARRPGEARVGRDVVDQLTVQQDGPAVVSDPGEVVRSATHAGGCLVGWSIEPGVPGQGEYGMDGAADHRTFVGVRRTHQTEHDTA